MLDTQMSLAPTHVRCKSVRPSVRDTFGFSILSASLVALREKFEVSGVGRALGGEKIDENLLGPNFFDAKLDPAQTFSN